MSKNYNRMTSRPNRKNRPETLLRLLMSTSYPHSSLADLMFAFSDHSGPKDQEELDAIADEMTAVERQFGMTDFIRTIEVLRNKDQVTIVIRTLDFDPSVREIVDNNQTHVELARIAFHLPAENTQLTDLDNLAAMLVNMFRKAQQDNIRADRVWRLRQRPTTKGNAKLGNADVPAVEELIDTNTVIALLTASLSKQRFHVVLTHNTILLFDQQRSLK
ncbi:hypothetical protein MZD04_gp265 [Pseudomonas phage Psa21]|uniref:Uncharacterized protein n=1 Tax=Pseudomonas phage Psa21 TaxID=2530023 RepID=A0A481W4S3_9CAUD|nr:hypothetical protein MZD04_gp265 [Pseudomonas phage Psa21]QBJ02791.1 hypothetical protein PSA21_265 [Pseudomonas phage Psa21]